MNRSIWIHLSLLLALLGAAWKVASPADEIEASSGGVVVLDLQQKDLKALAFESKKQSLHLEIENLDNDRFYAWAKLTTRSEVTQPVPTEEVQLESFPGSGQAAEADMETVVEESTRAFKGGKSLSDLLGKLTPFSAKRLIAQNPAQESLEKWGLVENTQTIVLQTSKGAHSFVLGGKTFRTKDRYVLDSKDQSVYLVDGKTFSVLTRSYRSLEDKSLLGAKESAISEIQVKGGEKSIALTHHNRADRQTHKWMLKSGKGNPDSLVDWSKKLMRLLAKSYVQSEDVPTGLQPVLSLTGQSDIGDFTMTLSKGTDPTGDIRWYAQSTHTRELVTLDGEQAAALTADFEGLVD
jgi:hypothetical protein